MGIEIERKFLVSGDYKSKSFKAYPIKQGYLSLSGVSVVRVRVKGIRHISQLRVRLLLVQ